MPAPDFVHEIDIRTPLAEIHTFLCDLHNYVALHPLIESIQEISPSNAMPKARRYRVVDRVPLGPFRMRAVYTASLEPVTASQIHVHAWQRPGVHLETIYALKESELGTRLVAHVSVDAPRLLLRFVVRHGSSSSPADGPPDLSSYPNSDVIPKRGLYYPSAEPDLRG
jgi:hypothetical protein